MDAIDLELKDFKESFEGSVRSLEKFPTSLSADDPDIFMATQCGVQAGHKKTFFDGVEVTRQIERAGYVSLFFPSAYDQKFYLMAVQGSDIRKLGTDAYSTIDMRDMRPSKVKQTLK